MIANILQYSCWLESFPAISTVVYSYIVFSLFQSILPNFVATNMSRMKPSLFVPDPDSYARDALNTVGISTRSDGFWGHKLTGLLFSLIPPGLFSKLSMDALKKFRANYLKKKSKTQ